MVAALEGGSVLHSSEHVRKREQEQSGSRSRSRRWSGLPMAQVATVELGGRLTRGMMVVDQRIGTIQVTNHHLEIGGS